MSIQALGHRVLVKPQKIEDVDKAFAAARAVGIQLLEQAERKEQTAVDKGIVVQIGSTAFKDFGGDPWVEVGDLVCYAKYGGKFITNPVDQEVYVVLNDEDLIAKLSGETNE